MCISRNDVEGWFQWANDRRYSEALSLSAKKACDLSDGFLVLCVFRSLRNKCFSQRNYITWSNSSSTEWNSSIRSNMHTFSNNSIKCNSIISGNIFTGIIAWVSYIIFFFIIWWSIIRSGFTEVSTIIYAIIDSNKISSTWLVSSLTFRKAKIKTCVNCYIGTINPTLKSYWDNMSQ